MKTKKKIFRNVIIILLCLAVVGVTALLIINSHVKSAGKDRILTVEQAAEALRMWLHHCSWLSGQG